MCVRTRVWSEEDSPSSSPSPPPPQASKPEQPEGDGANEEAQPLNALFLFFALVFILALPCTLPLKRVINHEPQIAPA